jgi:putative oxygen-independent coproporphyrinogen III oxidase
MLALPSLGLYIHIPWCIRKCPYCDFNSHQANSIIPESDYVSKLLADFDHDYQFAANRVISSIFIGGGTPSLFAAESYSRILNHLYAKAAFAADLEITLEANPGTAEATKFRGFHDAGINRLSIGIQSFNEENLKTLGRVHNAGQAKAAIEIAAESGFTNFNLDLMHGLPKQTEFEAMHDLDTAISYGPKHLSWYQLTIEPNTEFFSKPPSLPSDDVLGSIQLAGEALLAQHGYRHYEVSAFCKPEFESDHNTNYWRFGDYIGIGAGAHGKLTLSDNSIVRLRKHKQPKHYLANDLSLVAERTVVGSDDLPLEFLMNALRLRQGFSISDFERYTGMPFETIQKPIDSLIEAKLLVVEHSQVRTTESGWRFLNTVLETFL